MNVRLLIEAIVRQMTVLLAELATSGGLRAPLANVILRIVCCLAVLLFASMGCSKDCCIKQNESYRISGNPPDGVMSCPAMILDFYEGTSSQCLDDCTRSEQVPGSLVLEKKLPVSATWSVDVPISYLDDNQPSLDVYAHCDQNQNGRADNGEPCLGSTSLPAGSHDGVRFDVPSCPGRL